MKTTIFQKYAYILCLIILSISPICSTAQELNYFLKNFSSQNRAFKQLCILANYQNGEFKNKKLVDSLHKLLDETSKSNLSNQTIAIAKYFFSRPDVCTFLSQQDHDLLQTLDQTTSTEDETLSIKPLSSEQYSIHQRNFVQELVKQGYQEKILNAEGFFQKIDNSVFWYPPCVEIINQQSKFNNQFEINVNEFVLQNEGQKLINELSVILTPPIIPSEKLAEKISFAVDFLLHHSAQKYLNTNLCDNIKNNRGTLADLIVQVKKAFLFDFNFKITPDLINNLPIFASLLEKFLKTSYFKRLAEQDQNALKNIEKKLSLLKIEIQINQSEKTNLFEVVHKIFYESNVQEKYKSIKALEIGISHNHIVLNTTILSMIHYLINQKNYTQNQQFLKVFVKLLKTTLTKLKNTEDIENFWTNLFNEKLEKLQNISGYFPTKGIFSDALPMIKNQVKNKSLSKEIYCKGLVLLEEEVNRLSLNIIQNETTKTNITETLIIALNRLEFFQPEVLKKHSSFWKDTTLLIKIEKLILKTLKHDLLDINKLERFSNLSINELIKNLKRKINVEICEFSQKESIFLKKTPGTIIML